MQASLSPHRKLGKIDRALGGRSFAQTKGHRVARALAAWALLILLTPVSDDALAQAGYVHALSGRAYVQKTGGRAPLTTGDTIQSGGSFATGERGRLVLKFADGQLVLLGPGSVLRVDRYRYDAQDIKTSGFSVGLLNGSMRFVGGSITAQNRSAVRIGAGNSSIVLLSDKSTDFSIVVDTGDKQGETGIAFVAAGEIAVRTPYGRIRRILADQAVPWRPNRKEQPAPVPLAASPAVVQAAVAALRLAALPPSTPVEPIVAASVARSEAVAVAANSGPVGYVEAVSGLLSAERGNERLVLNVGDRFGLGTYFSTGETGRVVLKFTDGQTVTLGAKSSARIDRYEFNPRDINASGFEMTLLSGSLRFVAGSIASQDPQAAGISAGGSYITLLMAGGADFSVVVHPHAAGGEVGIAAVTKGEIAVRTPYGIISRIDANHAVPWRPGRGEPPPPVLLAALSPADKQALDELLETTNLAAALAELPATAAGPETAAQVVIAPLPGVYSAFTVTPPVTGCLGSPC